MVKYTFSQARQNFASVLTRAQTEGEVLIQRKDGSSFVIKPYNIGKSPFDVKGVNLKISTEEILDIIRESRER